MKLNIKKVSTYLKVSLEHDNISIDMGLLNQKEIQELRDSLQKDLAILNDYMENVVEHAE